LSPCIPGWRIKSDQTLRVGRLAAQTGLYPLLEYINGELVNKSKLNGKKIKVEEYLKLQGRFAHLFKSEQGKNEIKHIQEIADNNIKKYGL